ncbi:MAG: B12-binding domain-containing radical SAM protein [Verrucomicrobiales bacterium]|nr:B12-binding domain-containing radical SAM protein [Verrucomicrobiales bacterium]
MKRLLLISPLAAHSLMGGDFFFRMPHLGLLRVAALTPQHWDVHIVDEKVETLDLGQAADLVGITTMTPTAPRAYQLADHFRARGSRVVLGGMHASKMIDEALTHADAVVVGEAEGLWPRVVNDFEHGRLELVYQHDQAWPDLAGLPTPDWNRYREKPYLPVHFVETTRGCPIDCDFCSVTSAFGGRYRNRPLDDVMAELAGLRPFDGLLTLKNCVFFVDDNIVANRAYARQFLTRIADLGLKWFGQASMNIARDDEILRLCQRSGCVGLFVGFESLSEETLRSVGKRVNHPDRYLEVVRRLHDHGIGVDASFVFGFDTDGPEVFDRTLEFAQSAKLDIAYFSILTPYPGTRLHAQFKAQNRLLTEDWSLYDGARVVYRPKQMSPDQLLEGYHAALKELYRLPSIFGRLWGNGSYKNFFYPMNFGFRSSVRKLSAAYRRGELSVAASKPLATAA